MRSHALFVRELLQPGRRGGGAEERDSRNVAAQSECIHAQGHAECGQHAGALEGVQLSEVGGARRGRKGLIALLF